MLQIKKIIFPKVSYFVFALLLISTIRDTMVYYWSLPRQFLGNKLGAYGGNLTFYQVTLVKPPSHDIGKIY